MLFSSSTSRLEMPQDVRAVPMREASTGDVIVAEVLSENPAYPHLELPDGSLTTIRVGDMVVGALGSRSALRGFVGYAPVELVTNDTLALLNMGGVMGRFVDSTSSLGYPASVRYVGTVVDDAGVVNLRRAALPDSQMLLRPRPIVLAVGTCMNVGKTTTVKQLIQVLNQAGQRVGAAKLAGVAAVRDLRHFSDAGAVDVKSFLDCGLPSTVDAHDLAPVFKSVINALEGDVVLVELGDGIVGHYRVETVLTDPEIMRHVAAVLVCAGDIMAAYGAKTYLEKLGVTIDAFSGLATENVSGSGYIEDWLGIPAINAIKEPMRLASALGLID